MDPTAVFSRSIQLRTHRGTTAESVRWGFDCTKFFRRIKLRFSSRLRVTIVKTEKLHVDSTPGSDLSRKRGTLAGRRRRS
jgi:hypothetical protein